jgi:small subunit ribosomal protein S4e
MITTHDGRSIRYPHPDISINDSIKVNLATGEIQSVVKICNGATVMLIGGNNIGRIGVLQSVEKHPGSFDTANVVDSKDNKFTTRIGNVFVIGDGKTPSISLPKGEGIRLTLMEERVLKLGDDEEEAAAEESEN